MDSDFEDCTDVVGGEVLVVRVKVPASTYVLLLLVMVLVFDVKSPLVANISIFFPVPRNNNLLIALRYFSW